MWLETLAMHLSIDLPLPLDLYSDIKNNTGSSSSCSESTAPEVSSQQLKTITEDQIHSEKIKF